ncbi:MAG: hypothetical protein JXR71_08775 [Bacteroidales bacterium]|nr:hypothetical protein [Bacteroidales bacterium]
MKKTATFLFGFLFPFFLAAQPTVVPLGHFDKVHLGMTAAAVEQAYQCKVVKRGRFGGLIAHADQYNIETSYVTINLAEKGKVYQLKDLEFPTMHLEFINHILVEIKFIAPVKYIESEKKADALIEAIKWRYPHEYKEYKKYNPPSHESNNFTRSVTFSAQKFIKQRLGSEAQWNVHFKNIPSSEANQLRFSYAIKAPRKIKKPYYGGNIVLTMRYNNEIKYWKLFAELSKKCDASGLKTIYSFRGKNMGTSWEAFKKTYGNSLVAHDPQKLLQPKLASYVKVYTLRDENLSLLHHNLKGVYYIFYENKLQYMKIVFDTILPQKEFNTFRSDIKTVFGKPSHEMDTGFSETNYWSNEYVVKNFGKPYYASLREQLGEIPPHHFVGFNLYQTNLSKDQPTTISIFLGGLFTRIMDRYKEEHKNNLQKEF